jgi:hypothetical protein
MIKTNLFFDVIDSQVDVGPRTIDATVQLDFDFLKTQIIMDHKNTPWWCSAPEMMQLRLFKDDWEHELDGGNGLISQYMIEAYSAMKVEETSEEAVDDGLGGFQHEATVKKEYSLVKPIPIFVRVGLPLPLMKKGGGGGLGSTASMDKSTAITTTTTNNNPTTATPTATTAATTATPTTTIDLALTTLSRVAALSHAYSACRTMPASLEEFGCVNAFAVVREVFMIHVGGTRCVPSSTDNIMKIHFRLTLTVEFIRGYIFIFLY